MIEGIADKLGDDAVFIRLRRVAGGLLVGIRAIPEVEAMVRGWGEQTESISAYGRLWSPQDPGQGPLQVYSCFNGVNQGTLGGGANYRLDQPGQLFLQPNGNVNISFLRLKGITEGVTFIAEQVISSDEIQTLLPQLVKASKKFLHDYLVDVDLSASITNYARKA